MFMLYHPCKSLFTVLSLFYNCIFLYTLILISCSSIYHLFLYFFVCSFVCESTFGNLIGNLQFFKHIIRYNTLPFRTSQVCSLFLGLSSTYLIFLDTKEEKCFMHGCETIKGRSVPTKTLPILKQLGHIQKKQGVMNQRP